jgi:hypothetical protein
MVNSSYKKKNKSQTKRRRSYNRAGKRINFNQQRRRTNLNRRRRYTLRKSTLPKASNNHYLVF